METETFARFADARGIEGRDFEDDIFRIFVGLGISAAHDTGSGDGPVGVCNDDVGVIEVVCLVVDGIEFFAVLSASNEELVLSEFVGIEDVHGVTELEADEVCDIDDVVDGAGAACLDGASEPGRAFSDFDVVDADAHVSRAIFGGFGRGNRRGQG